MIEVRNVFLHRIVDLWNSLLEGSEDPVIELIQLRLVDLARKLC